MSKERKYYIGHEGRKVIGRIISIKGHCTYGLKVGDEFELSAQSPGGLCAYHLLAASSNGKKETTVATADRRGRSKI